MLHFKQLSYKTLVCASPLVIFTDPSSLLQVVNMAKLMAKKAELPWQFSSNFKKNNHKPPSFNSRMN